MIRREPGTTWRAYAACAGEDPELFAPIGWTSWVDRRQIADAKAVCARCPVIEACLEESLADRPDVYTIRGGATPDERAAMQNRPGGKRRPPAAVPVDAYTGPKRCGTCGETMTRPDRTTEREWATRKYCSYSCAGVAGAAKQRRAKAAS